MKTKQWLNNARFASWWLDFADLSWPDRHLTEKWQRRAETFRKQGVNAVVMFGFHFRWDYFSILDRVLGALREIAEICQTHGLKVVEHHSATLIHRPRIAEDRRRIRALYNHHTPFYPDDWNSALYRGEKMADWRQISARDGKPVFFEPGICECFCPNNPGFQKAYFDLIDRHVAAAPISAVMSDDLQFLPDLWSCACPHCQKKFKDETGFELPPASETNFWENQENPAWLAWVSARYRWNADYYRRLRKHLSPEILLWGRANPCLKTNRPQFGSSPQLFAKYFDAVFHEIPVAYHPQTHRAEIYSELAGSSSLAQHHQKPLIVLFYSNPPDVSHWLSILQEHGARPWISKRIDQKDAAPEEQLLEHGFPFPKTIKPKSASESVQAIVFSESLRDRLPPDESENYVEECRQLCTDLIERGSRPAFLFDSMWDSANPTLWECVWTLDSRALDDEKLEKLKTWQNQGLAVGSS